MVRNIRKNPTDSFSGIPAIVLGRRGGNTDKKKDAIRPMKLAFFSHVKSINISLVIKKKAITVKPKKKTGSIIVQSVIESEAMQVAIL